MEVASVRTGRPHVAVLGPDAAAAARALPEDAVVERPADLDELDTGLVEGRVDCVVTTGGPPAPAAVLERVRTTDADLPIVFAPPEPAPTTAATLAGDASIRYLPRELEQLPGDDVEVPDDGVEVPTLATVVTEAVETYDRRRQAAVERGLFETVMQLAPLAIYVKDAAGRHLAASSLAARAVEGQVVGRTDLDLFGPEDPTEGPVPPSYADDVTVLATGEDVEDTEERVELEGGAELWLRTSKRPITEDDGNVIGLLGVTHDVTPEKRQEQELRRESRRLEQFASFASHDLRNPLTVAKGNLELAAETGDPDHLEAAAEAIDRMEALIDDLLEIARPDEEREEEWVALEGVLERAWAAVETDDATLDVDLPPDLEVRATTGALRQLLENVLSNAVEHGGGRDDGVSIEVDATETGFSVADDGPGIPEPDREAVFEYGYTTGGSGIGLAIVAEIAEAHGWEPRIRESASGGTRLEIDRCLLRRAQAPDPVEGDPIDLGEWHTVGELAVEGGAERTGEGAWTIRGGGRSLWEGIEEYAALLAGHDGGVRVEARITGVESVHEYAKAGLLVADAPEPGRPLAFCGKTAEHGTEAAWRDEGGGTVDTHQAEPDAALPRYYRIDRLGDLVTMWASADGDDWRMVDRNALPLSGSVAVGLLVCSHVVGEASEATFEDVRVVSLSAPE